MKKIYVIMAAAALFAVGSCSKGALEKAEVEKDFTEVNTSNLPTPSLSSQWSVKKDILTLSASFDGGNMADESVKCGIVYGVDPTFAKSSYAEVQANGPVEVKVPTGTKVYFMAVSENGSAIKSSEVMAIDVPDIAWYWKVAPSYYGVVTSEGAGRGDSYKNAIDIEFSEDFKTVKITNIDPYLVSQGITYAKGYNYVIGNVDLETRKVTIPLLGGNPIINTNCYTFGAYEFYCAVLTPDFNFNNECVFEFSEDASTLSVPAMGTYSLSDDDTYSGFWEICDPAVYTAN